MPMATRARRLRREQGVRAPELLREVQGKVKRWRGKSTQTGGEDGCIRGDKTEDIKRMDTCDWGGAGVKKDGAYCDGIESGSMP